MPEIEPELVSLAHAHFQKHMPDSVVPQLCTCLRAHPCQLRVWAVEYLVHAGRLVLVSQPPAAASSISTVLGG